MPIRRNQEESRTLAVSVLRNVVRFAAGKETECGRLADHTLWADQEWCDQIWVLGKEHHLLPLLYHMLDAQGILECLTPAFTHRLRAAYQGSLARNIWVMSAAEQMLLALSNAGIPAIPLRGAEAVHGLYANPAWRPMADLDILIAQRDQGKAQEVVGHLGYQTAGHECDHQSSLLRRAGSSSILVELHGTPLRHFERNSLKVDLEGIWARSREANLGKVPCQALSPEDWLLLACLHAFRHGLGRYIWFCDILLFLQEKGAALDWQVLVERSKNWRASKLIFHCLNLLNRLFAPVVPQTVLDALRPSGTSRLFAELCRAVETGQSISNKCVPFFYLSLCPTLADKVRSIYQGIFWPRGTLARTHDNSRPRGLEFSCLYRVIKFSWQGLGFLVRFPLFGLPLSKSGSSRQFPELR